MMRLIAFLAAIARRLGRRSLDGEENPDVAVTHALDAQAIHSFEHRPDNAEH